MWFPLTNIIPLKFKWLVSNPFRAVTDSLVRQLKDKTYVQSVTYEATVNACRKRVHSQDGNIFNDHGFIVWNER
jgi:hypothetical protein